MTNIAIITIDARTITDQVDGDLVDAKARARELVHRYATYAPSASRVFISVDGQPAYEYHVRGNLPNLITLVEHGA
jgi:hypothetical protein